MDGALYRPPLHSSVEGFQTNWTPQVQKTGTWKWLKPVYARMDTGSTVQVSWNEPRPMMWEGLPLAKINAAEVDIFDPYAPLPPPGTVLPYPLRVLSLPNELLCVGDRRMVRSKPKGVHGEFEAIIVCRIDEQYPEIVHVEIGGSRPVQAFHISREFLKRLVSEGERCEDVCMLRLDLKEIPLSEDSMMLEHRFNDLLETIDSPTEWFEKHVVERSGRAARHRVEAFLRDENRIAGWLNDVSSRCHRRSQDDEDD